MIASLFSMVITETTKYSLDSSR